uniref:Rubicon Homology domain-containing protein n=1 Tax=Arcella intermedia TaxID=1963864 RepID=A0A6B2KZG6_9EUKA
MQKDIIIEELTRNHNNQIELLKKQFELDLVSATQQVEKRIKKQFEEEYSNSKLSEIKSNLEIQVMKLQKEIRKKDSEQEKYLKDKQIFMEQELTKKIQRQMKEKLKDQLEEERSILKQKNDERTEMIQILHKDIEALKKQNDALKEKILKLESHAEEDKIELMKYQKTISELDQEWVRINKENADLTKRKQQQEIELENQKTEFMKNLEMMKKKAYDEIAHEKDKLKVIYEEMEKIRTRNEMKHNLEIETLNTIKRELGKERDFIIEQIKMQCHVQKEEILKNIEEIKPKKPPPLPPFKIPTNPAPNSSVSRSTKNSSEEASSDDSSPTTKPKRNRRVSPPNAKTKVASVSRTKNISSPTSSQSQSQSQSSTMSSLSRNTFFSLLPSSPYLLQMDEDEHEMNDFKLSQSAWTGLKKVVILKELPRGSLENQNFLCFACGKEITWKLFAAYCHYSGKYFCNSCHHDYTAIIPSKVLFDWNFAKFPVSDFYYNFLKEIYAEPLFDIDTINPKIYNIVPKLTKIQSSRKKLRYMRDFIVTCRKKDELFSKIENRLYFIDTNYYSLKDLEEIYNQTFQQTIISLGNCWVKHITTCELCSGKGTVCEFCKQKEVIFPFQSNTTQCNSCKAIFHKKCYTPQNCPKCNRRSKQKQIKKPSKKKLYQ